MKTVYLAGLISTDYPDSLKWRSGLGLNLNTYFKVLDPLRDKKHLSVTSPDGGITTPEITSGDILLRDYQDVVSSDLVIAHLENFGCPRPMVGTIAELAWAWELKIPIIGIARADNYLMRNHPFIKEMVAHYVETVDEARKLAKEYYA